MPIADSGIEDLQARYAELVVRVGVNVQPGQEVLIRGLVEHAPVARAIARQAYLAGARAWAESRPAVIRLTGNPEPQLFADLDPTRVARLDPKDSRGYVSASRR